MRVLTNNPADCKVLNLGYYDGGRGPYVVCQDGIAPNSGAQQDGRFLLRKDGVWVLNLAVFAMPPKEQEKNFVCDELTEALQTLNYQRGKPEVEDQLPKGISTEQLLEKIKTAPSRLLSHLRDAKGAKM